MLIRRPRTVNKSNIHVLGTQLALLCRNGHLQLYLPKERSVCEDRMDRAHNFSKRS